jgi:hypothetical protein
MDGNREVAGIQAKQIFNVPNSVDPSIRIGLIRWGNQRSTCTAPNKQNNILVGRKVLGAGRASHDDGSFEIGFLSILRMYANNG